MEQVPRLVQWLISVGASVETIGPYPLHALIRLCIRAREFSPKGTIVHTVLQLRPQGLCFAQGKPECGYLNVE